MSLCSPRPSSFSLALTSRTPYSLRFLLLTPAWQSKSQFWVLKPMLGHLPLTIHAVRKSISPKERFFFLILLVVAMQQKVVAQIRRESVDWYVEHGRPEGAAVVRPRPARRSHVHEPSPDRNRAPSPMPRAAAAQSMPPLRPFVRRPSTLALPPQPQQRAVAVSSAATRDRFWARRPPIAVVPAPVKRMHLW